LSEPKKTRRSGAAGATRTARKTVSREGARSLAWLSGDALLLSGPKFPENPVVIARSEGTERRLEANAVNYLRGSRGPTGIAAVWLPGGRLSPPESLTLTAGGRDTIVDRGDLTTKEVALEQFVQDELADGDFGSRLALLEHVYALAHQGLERPGAITLATRLQALRDALRHPLLPVAESTAEVVSVELVMAVDERSFWVVGWLHDPDRSVETLALLTPEGQRLDLLETAYRHRRPDVEESRGPPVGAPHGFVAYVRLPHPSPLDAGWLVEVSRNDGVGLEAPAPVVLRDSVHARHRILDEFARNRVGSERLRLEHAHPALIRLQEERRRSVEIEDVVQYGVAPESPEVSIVVPLYKRIDLLEHQLTHFGQDPQIANADLLYVLDSPELADDLMPLAANLHALNEIPFRIVRLARNAGFAAANNAGISQSLAPLVLLLNSDVIPVGPGWLGRMTSFYDSTPDIGALGPKLLFEDLSIQHAGMYFKRERDTGLWGNMHYFKGFHREFTDACVSRPVPAVTGACMMVARDLYLDVGGLNDVYVQGGYEDSDFCLRVAQKGRRNWYLADVELYHLEAQSYPSPARRLTTFYNAWLQTHLWDETIDRLMREQEAHELASTGELVPSSRLSSV
jgi:O-antigen biosynthesis protein